MKKILFLLLLCLANDHVFAVPSIAPCIGTEGAQDAKALTALIKKQLPPGWGITNNEDPFRIEIIRLKPTAINDPLMYYPGWNPRVADEFEPLKSEPTTHFTFSLEIQEFISVANYQRLAASNHKIKQQMDKVSTGLLAGKSGFMARNAAEARRVKRYEQLEQSLHELPDYYWQHISLSKNEIPDVPDYERVRDEKVKKECKQVTLATFKLLHPYPKVTSGKR